jgi:hypothetical protein
MRVALVKMTGRDVIVFCLTTCKKCSAALAIGVQAHITNATASRLAAEHVLHVRPIGIAAWPP